jgi:hypothetical protein
MLWSVHGGAAIVIAAKMCCMYTRALNRASVLKSGLPEPSGSPERCFVHGKTQHMAAPGPAVLNTPGGYLNGPFEDARPLP